MQPSSQETGKWKGPLLILSAAALWSTAGLGIKSLSIPTMGIVGFRSVFALPVIAWLGSGARQFSAVRRPAVPVTALAYFFTICCFVAATRMTTAANAILLQYTAPVWVSLFSYAVPEERPHRRELLVAAVCLSGLTLFFLDRLTAEGRLGMAFAVLSGIAMAALVMGLRHEGQRGDGSASGVVVLGGNLLCVAAGAPFMAAAAPVMSGREWLILALLGSFQLGLSYVLFSAGLRRVPALRGTLLGLLEPLLNPVWVALGTGEIPGPGTMAGGLIVLGCLALDALIPRSR